MHKNQVWLAFLATVGLIVLWFTASTGYELYRYNTLNAKTSPVNIDWSVQAKASDSYFLQAAYRFEAKNRTYSGKTAFQSPFYRNRSAAELAIRQNQQKSWPVWYAAGSPETSTLSRNFPLKSCFYTAVLWGILLYFIWLGLYVEQFKTTRSLKD